ncbi:hypothetical protein [Devosia salina]|uniref:Uncharacterized protein n=1 Tax=Devosia salina TaxID=2860336 RepID=A0ABX8WCX9_9HYPH|nr:hypothetical protein [Devosia salina]QYO76556.1 hypothetical protein K1X15_18510 [Devosia salina]
MPMNTSPQSPLRVTAIAPDLAEETQARAQICYRLSRERRDMLHRLALDRRTNLQGLLDEAVGDLLAKLQADM